MVGRGENQKRTQLPLAPLPLEGLRFHKAVITSRLAYDVGARMLELHDDKNNSLGAFSWQVFPWGVVILDLTDPDLTTGRTCIVGERTCGSLERTCIHEAFFYEVLLGPGGDLLEKDRVGRNVSLSVNRQQLVLYDAILDNDLLQAVRVIDDLFIIFSGEPRPLSAAVLVDGATNSYHGFSQSVDYVDLLFGKDAATLTARSTEFKKLKSLWSTCDPALALPELIKNQQLPLRKNWNYPLLLAWQEWATQHLGVRVQSGAQLVLAEVRPDFVCNLCKTAPVLPESCPHVELRQLANALAAL